MTFNAEFLWDGVDPEEGQADFAWKGSPAEAKEHMKAVAAVIIRSNPDIINLVEVEGLDALNIFNKTFLSGRGYKIYLVKGGDTFTGQDVCLLTRIDPIGGKIVRDDRKGSSGNVTKSVSKNYVAKFNVDGLQFSLIGVHLLAQPNNPARRFEREAQADAVVSIAVDLETEGFHPIVLGDFNDYDGDNGCRDHINSMPTTNVLSSIKGMTANDESDDLMNVSQRLPQATRYTAFWDQDDDEQIDLPNEYTSIDHILVPPSIADRLVSVTIDHTHDPRLVSDHFPVMVTLQTAEGDTTPDGVVISELLPNPEGNDSDRESVTLKNLSAQKQILSGWTLRDLHGDTWPLNGLGSLEPGQSITVLRKGQPMSLNNDGDTIELIDSEGNIVSSVTYGPVSEGEIVSGHE